MAQTDRLAVPVMTRMREDSVATASATFGAAFKLGVLVR